ncbi:MAG: hypothetical protein ACI93T_001019, partial [Porticoccaceae bacterium]
AGAVSPAMSAAADPARNVRRETGTRFSPLR